MLGRDPYSCGEQEQSLTTDDAFHTSITPRGPPEPVFNLEVDVDHVYNVGQSGLLVHNSCNVVLYPGSKEGLAGGIIDMELAKQNKRLATEKAGTYWTDDFTRASIYGRDGHIARTEVSE